MKFSRRAAATSRAVISRSLWNKIKSQFLNEISQKVLLHSIPDKLIMNAYQTPPKCVHGSQGARSYFKCKFQWQKKYYLNSLWISWWQNPTVPTDLQGKDTKMAPNRWFSPTIFVYLTMKNIGLIVRRPSVLLSRSLCHTLTSLKKKKIYQTPKKSPYMRAILKLSLWRMYLMFCQSKELNLLWYQRTWRICCNHWI